MKLQFRICGYGRGLGSNSKTTFQMMKVLQMGRVYKIIVYIRISIWMAYRETDVGEFCLVVPGATDTIFVLNN